MPKHLDRIQRELVQVLAHQIQLFQDVVRHGDDITPDIISLEDVQQLAGASPDQFNVRLQTYKFYSRGHERHRISASIRDTAGENRHKGRRPLCQDSTHVAHLI